MANIVKAPPTKEWLPSVNYLVADKLATIPLRVQDQADKRLKDFLDIHNLVFHNRAGLSARDLAEANQAGRAHALPFLAAARQHDTINRRGTYAPQLEFLGRWLQ